MRSCKFSFDIHDLWPDCSICKFKHNHTKVPSWQLNPPMVTLLHIYLPDKVARSAA